MGTATEFRDFNFYYDLEKATNIRLAQSLARQLRRIDCCRLTYPRDSFARRRCWTILG